MNPQLSTEEQEHLKGIFQSKNVIYTHFLPDIDNDAKFDINLKIATLLIGISSFLPEPINLKVRGGTSTGKTFVVKNVLSYFPKNSVIAIGKQSPTAFYHDNGILMNKDGQEINLDNEPMKPIRKVYKTEDEFEEAKQNYKERIRSWNSQLKESYNLIDLSHKILFFLDEQNPEVETNLFPILSHDAEEISFKFTDKTAKGNLKTRHVIVKGFPTVISLRAREDYQKRADESSTRTISTEESAEKYKSANKMATMKNSRKWEQHYERIVKTQLKEFLSTIQSIFVKDGYDTIIPFENMHELYPYEEARDMRDYTHFQQFINSITAVHIHQRVIAKIEEQKYVLSSVQDVQLAFDIFKDIFEATRANTDKALLDFYWNYVFLLEDGFEAEELMDSYNKANLKKHYSKNTIYQKLNLLAKKGYLDKKPSNFGDRKIINFIRLKKNREELVYNPLDHENKLNLSVFLEEGLKSWFSACLSKVQFYKLSNSQKDKDTFERVEITRQEAEEIILCKNRPF